MIRYYIHELTDDGNVFHGWKPTAREADEKVNSLRKRSRNNFVISPEYVSPVPAVVPAPVTAEELFVKNHPEDTLADQPYKIKIIYQMLAETATTILRQRGVKNV